MDKLYERINYENLPSRKTRLNAANLNKMDKAIDDLDNRIIEQDAAFAKSIESENKKIEDANGKISTLTDTAATLTQSKSDAITVEKSGTTIVATDSSDKGFEQFKTYGWGKQDKTLGNQLFDKDTRTNGSYKHYNSGSVIVNADFFYSDYIKVSQGNYTVSGISVNDPHVCFYDANKNYLSGVLARNFTVPQDGYMVFSAPIVDADNIMLNKGSTALPWEPYTGNIPSPNPEYPQPIVSAGQKLAEGNQLLDLPVYENTTSGVTCTVDENGVATLNGTASEDVYFSMHGALLSSNGKYANVVQISGRYNGIIQHVEYDASWGGGSIASVGVANKLHDTLEYVWFRIIVTSGTVCDNLKLGYIVSTDPNADWEPYTGGVKKAYDVGIQKKVSGKNSLKVTDVMYSVKFDSEKGTVKSIATKNTASQTAKAIMWKGTDRIEIFFSVTGVGFKEFPFRKQEGYEKLTLGFNGDKEDATITCDLSNLKNGGLYKIVFVIDSISQNSSSMSGVMVVEDSITDYTYEPYTEQTLTLNRVLRGIQVTDPTLATYTDADGKMWCADYADVDRKVWVQRIGVINSSESVTKGGADAKNNGHNYVYDVPDVYKLADVPVLCTHYTQKPEFVYWVEGDYISSKESTKGMIYIASTTFATLEEFKVGTEGMEIQYILATPIETPMTDEEIAMYNALHTNKPNTIITNDAGCFMEVEYVADTKTHIAQNYVPVSKYTALEDRVSALERLHV